MWAMTTTQLAHAVARRYATAWAENDLATVVECYAPNFTLHYFGDNPFTGSHVGRDAAFEVLIDVGARAPRTLIAVDEILAGPNAAVLVARERMTVDESEIEVRRVLRYRVDGDAFVECWLYEENQDVIDRAWAEPARAEPATT